ncbi:MAG TPA: sugar ABC transporter ATP-binding protein [Hyphomicrobiales bacterium]|nr:sugar ABC transporter ATP-binding protein [Hyphomicrobiales bacterium]
MLQRLNNAIELRLSGVTKVYPGVIALQDVDLSISGGEVVGLIGENGAGKSTLMKVLGGAIAPDRGTIEIDGEQLTELTTVEATERGIAFVHQELNHFTNLDVAGNILLGREITTGPLKVLDTRTMAQRVQPILDMLGTRFGPHDSVADLSLAEQQLLEIARALSMNARLVILDEPTSSLTLSETQRLLDIVRQLKSQGVAILFISHRLAEVEEIADRVVVLRDGRNVGELTGDAIEKNRMVSMMIGRDIEQFYEKYDHRASVPALEFRGVKTRAFPDEAVNLIVRAGEILGLAGLVGAGRTELACAAFGVDPMLGGEVILYGEPLPASSVAASLERGLCLVPENRKEEGLFLDFEIANNIALPNLPALSRFGVVDRRREWELAEASQKQLAIKVVDLSRAVAELSGGNQQKVVLAKWLAMNPKVVILDEPTRGIDVGAKAEVYQLMQALAKQGVGILMISSDMEEVIGVSDRVAVMCKGKIAGTLNADELTEENILRLAVG